MASEAEPELDLAEVERSLLARRARLRAQIFQLSEDEMALAESRDQEGGAFGDHGDVASDLIEQEIDEALEEETRLELAEVEDALDRLQNGRFGLCEDCGQPIAPARLEARPWARRCVQCQQVAEQRGHGRGA